MKLFVKLFLLTFFTLFLIVPVYIVVHIGLDMDYFLEVFKNEIYLEGLLNSFEIALVTTLIVFLFALPLAFVFYRYEFRGKNLLNGMVLLPMILPPFVGALGFSQMFGQYGVINSFLTSIGLVEYGKGIDFLGEGGFFAVCFVEALHLFPILYLNCVTALSNTDPSLNEAAKNMGAGPVSRFFKITLPMIKSGLFAGGTIVFIWSFTELGTPLMLGYNRVTPVQIFNGITELETNMIPFTLVVIVLVIASSLYGISRLLLGRSENAMIVKGMTGSAAKTLEGWRSFMPILPFALVLGLAVLPHIGMMFLSVADDWFATVLPSGFTMEHYSNALSHRFVLPSIKNSIFYSFFAMIVCVIVGVLTSIITVRWKTFGWQFFDVMSMLPLGIPGIVMAFGYLNMASSFDFIQQFTDPVENPALLLILAYAMRRIPYVVRAASAGLEQTPVELEFAAKGLGASPFYTFRKITAPLVSANLIIGAMFAFSFSMLEVSDSLILAHKADSYPITRAIFELSQVLGPGNYIACAFGVWAMLFLGFTLVAASVLMGRKMGSLFKF